MSDEQPSLPLYDPLEVVNHEDGTWIRVEQAELVDLIEHKGTDHEVRWEVLSGRTLTSWRKRTEADGDAEVEVIPPKPRPVPPEEKIEYPGWGQGGRVDPRVAEHHRTPAPPGAFGGTGSRNVGAMNPDGTIRSK